MTLCDRNVSGNAYKMRPFLALLDIPHKTVPVNIAKGEQNMPEFLKLNSRGQILMQETDKGMPIWNSTAIRIFLARRYGEGEWLPLNAEAMADVM